MADRRTAGSPTSTVRSAARYTTDGALQPRLPNGAISARPSRQMPTAVYVVPTSTPSV